MSSKSDVQTLPCSSSIEDCRAFVANVGQTNIWLANESGVIESNLEQFDLDPQNVLTVSLEATNETTDHVPLYDGRINSPEEFAKAVDLVLEYLRTGSESIVNCAVGISRSPCVIATAISIFDSKKFDESLQLLNQVRPQVRPHEKLLFNSYYHLHQHSEYTYEYGFHASNQLTQIQLRDRDASIQEFDLSFL